uniref:HHH_2 domain-containing protein n=1 Tax=Rhabditophanes sp. KR3021 TaxID=114890 RepID=A0AC35TIW9_9BILA
MAAPGDSAGSKVVINMKTQQNNILHHHLKSCRLERSFEIKADYEAGKTCGVLFLATTYHRKNPDYINKRYNDLTDYRLKVVLLLCVGKDEDKLLHDVNSICLTQQWTLLICYSYEEAGEYLENLARSENMSEDSFKGFQYQRKNGPKNKEITDTDRYKLALDILSSIRLINKTDAAMLIMKFGSIRGVANAPIEVLEEISGMGNRKAMSIINFFGMNFVKPIARARRNF